MKTRRIMHRVPSCFAIILGLVLAPGCGDHGHEHGDTQVATIEDAEQAGGHSHLEGPNGGELLDAGTHDVHLELVHEHGEAKAVFHLMGPDAKTPIDADGDLVVNIMTEEGPRQITARAVESTSCFEIDDPLLAGEHVHGQVEVTVKGKTYYVPLPDHEHEADAGHEGEGAPESAHDEDADH